MAKKTTSKTPSDPAVDRAAPCSDLLGKLGWFQDAGKRICIAQVKEVEVECPLASNMLRVLYERWPECEKHDGYIAPEDFHPLLAANFFPSTQQMCHPPANRRAKREQPNEPVHPNQ